MKKSSFEPSWGYGGISAGKTGTKLRIENGGEK